MSPIIFSLFICYSLKKIFVFQNACEVKFFKISSQIIRGSLFVIICKFI